MTMPASPDTVTNGVERVRGVVANVIEFAATEARGLAGRVRPPVSTPAAEPVETFSDAEGRMMLERAAQRHLNISAEEFIRRHDAGEYDDVDDPTIARVAILLPLGR